LRLVGAVRRALCPDPDQRPPTSLNAKTLLTSRPLHTQVLEYRKVCEEDIPGMFNCMLTGGAGQQH
jgi:hypothetical protein